MKHLYFVILMVVAVTFAGSTAFAEQQDDAATYRFASWAEANQRFADMEARLASMENFAGDEVDCNDYCGFSFSAELLILRPFQSDQGSASTGTQAAPRIALGYTRSDGLGIRLRWFEYSDVYPEPGGDLAEIDFTYLDFEITDRFDLSQWDGILSAGIRVAEFDEVHDLDVEANFDGAGLLLGVEMNRQITCNWSLFLLGRESLVYGSEYDDDGYMLMSITELQLGAEYRWPWRGTADGFIRIAGECQYLSGLSDDDVEDFGVAGVTLALGFTR